MLRPILKSRPLHGLYTDGGCGRARCPAQLAEQGPGWRMGWRMLDHPQVLPRHWEGPQLGNRQTREGEGALTSPLGTHQISAPTEQSREWNSQLFFHWTLHWDSGLHCKWWHFGVNIFPLYCWPDSLVCPSVRLAGHESPDVSRCWVWWARPERRSEPVALSSSLAQVLRPPSAGQASHWNIRVISQCRKFKTSISQEVFQRH